MCSADICHIIGSKVESEKFQRLTMDGISVGLGTWLYSINQLNIFRLKDELNQEKARQLSSHTPFSLLHSSWFGIHRRFCVWCSENLKWHYFKTDFNAITRNFIRRTCHFKGLFLLCQAFGYPSKATRRKPIPLFKSITFISMVARVCDFHSFPFFHNNRIKS